ncbi:MULTISPECIES: hypothetical protein [unclassified Gilliamella]|uniref:hypothetical protein n=1 Tax=unclassified Gilliamella TaxID=2685620 RepID=UPI001147603F|nr:MULTISPECIES: hypothetical protein [Gilliamella]MWP61196.1 hypothetical protein [Gilliamella sp. Pas-s25]NUF50464.1 hypothetical protein [Gilliamella sp. ESL0250]
MTQLEKNLDLLKILTYKIKTWDRGNDYIALSKLISDLEKLTRKEYSLYYKKFFTDISLAEQLIQLYKNENLNKETIINIVSCIGNMIERYSLPPLNDFFDFFNELKTIKKIDYYVSLFITEFPQFYKDNKKWDYLLSILNISPKAKSERNFYIEIKKILNRNESIPNNYIDLFIASFEEMYNKAKNDFYKNDYKEIILKLSKLK